MILRSIDEGELICVKCRLPLTEQDLIIYKSQLEAELGRLNQRLATVHIEILKAEETFEDLREQQLAGLKLEREEIKEIKESLRQKQIELDVDLEDKLERIEILFKKLVSRRNRILSISSEARRNILESQLKEIQLRATIEELRLVKKEIKVKPEKENLDMISVDDLTKILQEELNKNERTESAAQD